MCAHGSCCTLRRSECCSSCLCEGNEAKSIQSSAGQVVNSTQQEHGTCPAACTACLSHSVLLLFLCIYLSPPYESTDISYGYRYIADPVLLSGTRIVGRHASDNCLPSTRGRKKASHPQAMYTDTSAGASQRLLLALVFLRVVPPAPGLAALPAAVPLLAPCSCIDSGPFSYVPLRVRVLGRASDTVPDFAEGSGDGGDSSLTAGTASFGWSALKAGCSVDPRPKWSAGSA
jgi:hypothetical protein